MSYARQTDALLRHLSILPFGDALERAFPDSDPETWTAVVEQAALLAEAVIDPLDAVLDGLGARLVDGRVRCVPGHRAGWDALVHGGWLTLPLAPEQGGQGLPLVLNTACEELFNRASAAFTMLATPGRTAAAMLAGVAEPALREVWVPKLLSGEWTATICISEADAGSDVARLRTRATQDGGQWRVTGEKIWISYGDHDLAGRIGHFMLARSSDAAGVRGLSLFLVPDRLDDGTRNTVEVRRIEHKLGLHGSPTCVIGFDGAAAMLIGAEGRGLQTLFPMMLQMRLSCAPQGVGVAEAALETALDYAQARRQGGDAAAPPVPIVTHADVQRQLLAMAARVEIARGIALATATVMDLGSHAPEAERAGWLMLAHFLLPIAKDGSARLAFDVSSGALQVLGGAGYTREWPVERRLRDSRVFAVFEGTTGIQAIDMLHRRLWRDRGGGLSRFLILARADLGTDARSATAGAVFDLLETTAATLMAWETDPQEADAGATAFLDLCGVAVGGWIALRISLFAGEDAVGRRLRAAADFYLADLPIAAEAEMRRATQGSVRLKGIDAYVA